MGLARTVKLLVVSVSAASLGIAGYTLERKEVQAQEQPRQSSTKDVASDASADVQALVQLGPRVAGTPTVDRASRYLIQQYRRAGYVTKIYTFTYPKFEDLGSSLTVNGRMMRGQALNGSMAGNATAPLVAVPNTGRSADFTAVNVKGAIAIVRRGEIRFLDKARNAAAAGAAGLVIVNNQPGNLYGTLGGEVNIPVLSLSSEQGNSLQQVQSASLAVNTRQHQVTGRNVVAHLPGVVQPRVILGGHYDSVAGSPGANDNASGTAVVLAIARQTASTPLGRQAWFIAFDGEEDGLHGSRAFVRQAEPQFLQGLKGMLNFDMVGVNNQLRVGGTKTLTTLVQAAAPGVSIFGSYSGSDHAPFASAGVPVLFFYRGQEPNYHKPSDRTVNSRLLDETAQVGLTVLQRLVNPATTVGVESRFSLEGANLDS